MRFFADDIDGVGTIGFTHANGETETISVTGDKKIAENVAESLNNFFGSDPQNPPSFS